MKKNANLHKGHFERIRKKVIQTAPAYVDDVLMLEALLRGLCIRADGNEFAMLVLRECGAFRGVVGEGIE